MNNIPLHEFAEHVSEYEYVAWVPCIAGRLNYKNAPSKTTLGSLQVPRGLNVKVGVGSNGEQGYRALAVTSTHNWQDTVDNNASGDFKVLVVGRDGLGCVQLGSQGHERGRARGFHLYHVR